MGNSQAEPGSAYRQRILVRYSGDLTTKARATRRRFEQRLLRNLKDALAGTPGVHFSHGRDRIVIELQGPIDPAPLARVPGVQTISIAEQREWQSLEDLVAAGAELFGERVVGRRFAVRARRVGERGRIRVNSQELERQLGAVLASRAAGVDLSNPEVTAYVEIMPDQAYFFSERIPAPGGLPLGVEGHAVALVSGGFDSLVAAWQLLKRGVALDYVFCNLGGRAHQLEALRALNVLSRDWSYGARPHLHAIDFDAVSRDLQAKVTQRYWQVVLKRLMLRAAEKIAIERDAAAIVTGDALGQVSSQTLRNLATISEATSLPILRPLVGFNKDEILVIARRIGTYDLSAQVGEYCAIVPSKPATGATAAVAAAEEARLDPSVLERAIAERSVLDLRELDLHALETPGLATDRIGAGDTVIDLRSKAAYQSWHYPDALFMDFRNALRAYPSMPREGRRYVIYCEFGLKSAHLAELMQREGFDASHFGNGLSELIRFARENGIATPEL